MRLIPSRIRRARPLLRLRPLPDKTQTASSSFSSTRERLRRTRRPPSLSLASHNVAIGIAGNDERFYLILRGTAC